MATSNQEISNVIQQHQAVQAHMKFLINAVGRLHTQSDQEIPDSTSLKNRIALYRWSLYDFKEAIQRQIDFDERIFPGSRSNEGIIMEHREILKRISDTIVLAENAVDNKTSREELSVYSIKIVVAVNRICETLETHMAKEDELIRQH